MDNITMKHILNRRSIRKYKNEEVPEDIILNLLKGAMNAPSACNQQIWHFVIIEDKDVLEELSKIHGGYLTLKNTRVAILVCGEVDKAILPSFWEHDCAAATENILIGAEYYGLGAIWMGVNPATKEDGEIIKRVVELPDNIQPFSIVALGYPAEVSSIKSKFDDKKIHYKSKW